MSDVTRILGAIQAGQPQAAEELLPLVYGELRKLAAQKLAQEKPGQTLDATALVHEAYLRLVGPTEAKWDHRGHFFAAAAEAMRRILVENARRKRRAKHGGGHVRVPLSEAELTADPADDDLLALDEALERFTRDDPQAAQLVKLKHFGGMSLEQAAEVLGISRATAYRQWTYARAWLRDAIEGDGRA
ncbi:MAG TPA: sigma-70 family RNA polymerase sigma factor [Pirellulales bacterium]|jgi:RNA polymerase sigma factor (TIGR02999 family)|nr:sigma-70 family RNA polymerase sigma factor [Pirellulales bacterium]